jgi:hypothetical protein
MVHLILFSDQTPGTVVALTEYPNGAQNIPIRKKEDRVPRRSAAKMNTLSIFYILNCHVQCCNYKAKCVNCR